MLTPETNFRENLKRALTAIAATIGVVIGVNSQLTHQIPHAVISWLADAAILVGILGASPLGRLIWRDPPVTTEEVQKPIEGAVVSAEGGAKPVSGG